MTHDELKPLKLRQGDLLTFVWWDIAEDSVGDTTKADLVERTQSAHFWEVKDSAAGIPILVTCSTLDTGGPEQQGSQATPLAVITSIEVVRRARKKRKSDG